MSAERGDLRVRGRRGAHEAGIRRWPLLALVVLSLVGAGLVDRAVAAPPSTSPMSVLASAAAPLGAESSSWYCTGGSGDIEWRRQRHPLPGEHRAPRP